MMDLPGIDFAEYGENVYCHRNVKDIQIERVKKWSHQTHQQHQRHQQQQHQSKNSRHILANECATSARNRTTATALLLYISYTLSIHLLWTNCVIFTESAQLNLNINSSWNSLLQHQQEQLSLQQQHQHRTESNRSLNSNNNNNNENSHNNLKSNLGIVNGHNSHSQSSHSVSVKLNGPLNRSNANQLKFLTEIPEFSANHDLASTSMTTIATASTATPSSTILQPIDVNHTVTGNEAVSTVHQARVKHFYTINRLKRTTSITARQHKIPQQHPPRPASSPLLSSSSISASAISNSNTHSSKRNEFMRSSDEIRFKRYQSERENVIKSAKNHAIKRNVNTFTPAILGDNSNLSIINAVNVQSKTIKPSSLSTLSSMEQHKLITNITTMPTKSITNRIVRNSTAVTDAKSMFNAHDLATNVPINVTTATTATPIPHNQLNQTVNDDSKLKATNRTAINRMENNRNNSQITSNVHALASTIATTIPAALTTMSMLTATTNPTTRHFSSSSPAPSRIRVNDVFEMDTKQKYFNMSHQRNKDNQVTSIAGDGQTKWHVQHRNGKRIISLLGLFELSTRNGSRVEGLSELAAAQLAVRHINKRDHLLPGYTLQLITNDTKCDPGVGVDRFFHAVYTKRLTRVQMLLGSACSEVTESLAKVVPHWNIVQVSFGSTSPALSDRSEFPLFYRTVAPDSSHNPARIAFIRRFGWYTVSTFSQNEEIHSLAVNDLVTELENANISCAATITFAETDFKNQLKMLRDLDTRIIIGSFSHDLAPKIFCEAHQLGMYGADYVWILHEIVGNLWWDNTTHECNQKQLQEVSENLLIVSSHNSIVSNEISYSGLTYSMFIDELHSQLNVSEPPPLSRYAAQTYDAVWAMALALSGAETKWKQWKNNSSVAQLQLDHFDYTRYDMALEFFHQFSRLNFLGVSGPVSFSGADRIPISVFSQVQDGRLQSVALFHPSQLHLDFDCLKCVPIKWKNGQVPIAKRIFKLRVATISPLAFFIVSTLALIGIILSIAFLAFNLHFRKLKTIKLSSPKLSNITAFGCILVYAAVILLGLDHATLPANEKAFPVVCTARVYLLSSGFSLAFGSMFAKTYRVHRIFTRSGSSVCKDKMLQDAQLISLVCALLLLDGLVLTLWVVFDPMERHLSNLTLEISSTDRSVVYQPQVEVCRSQHTQTWLGALYIFKGLLLVVGVYMAWETRHVKIPALNDSQYIGVSVYSVVITSALVVVLANLISERVTLAFLTITALILTSTTATLCLLFLPKMQDIWGKGVINDPVIHSMGLKMECNTRRFMIDDKRELQYRVEVQNRVYKKELAALDIEIGKLEKLLETPSSTSSSDLSIPRLIKHELAVVNEENEKSSTNNTTKQQRTPSIGGGLPLLLLSVLPPVIPRASWPSADIGNNTMRKSVTFSSQPQLEDESCVARLPAIDLLHLRLTHQQATADARKGLIDRIIGFFGSKPPSRKASTSSIAGGSSGIAAALKVHMGLFSNIVPTASSCNAIDMAGIRPLRKMSIARSGTAINTRCSSVTYDPPFRERSIYLPPPPPFIISTETDSTNSSRKNIYVDTDHETKVNFYLPSGRRASILNQQPTLRERVRGSPRFPHRIAPTSSLNALVESTETASGASSSKSKWKSMEDSTMFASSSTTFNTSNC